MSLLTVVITHLDAARTEAHLAHLRATAPDSRFVVCHGGARADFERLESDAVFVDDLALRGPSAQGSYNRLLPAAYDRWVRADPAIELIHVIEYDHLVLSARFEDDLRGLFERSGRPGLIAKGVSPRGDTNWPHVLRYRDDARLNRYVTGISVRDDPHTRWGCLGAGMVFGRDALDALCGLENPPSAYLELLIPTLVHHLGFDVADPDAFGDLYRDIRWRPEYSIDEVLAARRAGRSMIHPFKRVDELARLIDG